MGLGDVEKIDTFFKASLSPLGLFVILNESFPLYNSINIELTITHCAYRSTTTLHTRVAIQTYFCHYLNKAANSCLIECHFDPSYTLIMPPSPDSFNHWTAGSIVKRARYIWYDGWALLLGIFLVSCNALYCFTAPLHN